MVKYKVNIIKHNQRIKECFIVLISFFILELFLRTKSGITIFSDTIGIYAFPAKLANYNWSDALKTANYYGPGCSIIDIPLFFLCKDPVLLYNLIGNINLFIEAIGAAILYGLIDKYCNPGDFVINAFASMFGTYCTIMSLDGYTNSPEQMNVLLSAVICLLLCKILTNSDIKGRIIPSCFLLMCLAFSIPVHIRNIVFCLGILFVYLWVFFATTAYNRNSIVTVLFILLLMLISLFLYKRFPQVYSEYIYGVNDNLGVRTNSEISINTSIPFRQLLEDAFKVLLGNIFQSVKQTYGSIIISYYLIIQKATDLYKRVINKSKPTSIDLTEVMFIYSSSMYLIGLAGLAISWAGSPRGSGYWRYYGTYSAIMISISIVYAFKNKPKIHPIVVLLLCSVFLRIIVMLSDWITDEYLSFWFTYRFLQKADARVLTGVIISATISFIGAFLITSKIKNKQIIYMLFILIFCIIPNLGNGGFLAYNASTTCDTGYSVINTLSDCGYLNKETDLYFIGYDWPHAYYQWMMMENGISRELPDADDHIYVFSHLDNEHIVKLSSKDGWQCLPLDDNEYVYSKDKQMLININTILEKISN